MKDINKKINVIDEALWIPGLARHSAFKAMDLCAQHGIGVIGRKQGIKDSLL